MSIEVKPLSLERMDDLGELFAQDQSASKCWCMWFIESVRDFHAAGADGNRQKFERLANASKEPLGLIAYRDGTAVGWCAIGPKERYARAIKTPTLKGLSEVSSNTWFVPCFFVPPGERRTGVTKALLGAAIALAQQHGAGFVEGFPAVGPRPAASGDRQVGSQGVFAAQGFDVVHQPSSKRVVMRRQV